MVKLGIIVLSNNSGLGNQTRRLCQMLKPYRILAVDSSSFSRNAKQNWHWYDNFSGYITKGFPTQKEVDVFLQGLTHVLCAENPFSFYLLSRAKQLGIKVYIQSNYEFCDHLVNHIELPTKFLMPSHWMVDEMIARFGADKVEYLPPPIMLSEFTRARDKNLIHTGPAKLLHVIGTLAAHDRNGTLDLLRAVHMCKSEFTLIIRSQHPLPQEYITHDHRVRYDIRNVDDINDMYEGFDALILPRRYGGLTLTMNEALMSGMPVIMPDISPNNKILPKEWLVPAHRIGKFTARTPIDIYGCDIQALASRIDWVASQDCEKIKTQALDIAYENFADSVLLEKYQKLWV